MPPPVTQTSPPPRRCSPISRTGSSNTASRPMATVANTPVSFRAELLWRHSGTRNMTLRINSVWAAMAALALIIMSVTTAGAAVQISDGRLHYEPPGYRMPDSTGTPRTRVAQSGNCIGGPWRCHYGPEGRLHWGSVPNANRAAWGCFATDGKARGRSWSYPNRASALYAALSQCTKISTRGSCRVVGCRPSIHTNYESQAIWLTGVHR